jgi:hypothetical protein
MRTLPSWSLCLRSLFIVLISACPENSALLTLSADGVATSLMMLNPHRSGHLLNKR